MKSKRTAEKQREIVRDEWREGKKNNALKYLKDAAEVPIHCSPVSKLPRTDEERVFVGLSSMKKATISVCMHHCLEFKRTQKYIEKRTISLISFLEIYESLKLLFFGKIGLKLYSEETVARFCQNQCGHHLCLHEKASKKLL